MKIFIKVVDDDFYKAEVAMVAAETIDEAKFVLTGTHSKDEYVAATVEHRHPKNHRDQYKTEAGWKQAMSQFEKQNKDRYEREAVEQYYYAIGDLIDTGIEIQAEKAGVIWERSV